MNGVMASLTEENSDLNPLCGPLYSLLHACKLFSCQEACSKLPILLTRNSFLLPLLVGSGALDTRKLVDFEPLV